MGAFSFSRSYVNLILIQGIKTIVLQRTLLLELDIVKIIQLYYSSQPNIVKNFEVAKFNFIHHLNYSFQFHVMASLSGDNDLTGKVLPIFGFYKILALFNFFFFHTIFNHLFIYDNLDLDMHSSDKS